MRQLYSTIIVASLWLAGLALASASDGTAVGVKPQADAQTGKATRTLVVGADVFSGERVITGNSGQVQILFDDQTRLVVGPGSSLVIEDYLKRSDQTAGKVAIKALAGTFRFVTGNSAKSAYTIKTPTGAIGVRGTAFDFTVGQEGTIVLLFHGAVQLCNLAGKCVQLTRKCEVGTFDTAEAFVIGRDQGSLAQLRSQFPYSTTQAPLLRDFRVAEARGCFNASSAEAPASIGSGSAGGLPGTGGAAPPPPPRGQR